MPAQPRGQGNIIPVSNLDDARAYRDLPRQPASPGKPQEASNRESQAPVDQRGLYQVNEQGESQLVESAREPKEVQVYYSLAQLSEVKDFNEINLMPKAEVGPVMRVDSLISLDFIDESEDGEKKKEKEKPEEPKVRYQYKDDYDKEKENEDGNASYFRPTLIGITSPAMKQDKQVEETYPTFDTREKDQIK